MNPLVPADKQPNPFLDANLGLEPELLAGPPQVRVRDAHVTRLVAVALDPSLAPERAADQRDQPVEPHAGPTPDVDRLREPLPAGAPRPLHPPPHASHAVR